MDPITLMLIASAATAGMKAFASHRAASAAEQAAERDWQRRLLYQAEVLAKQRQAFGLTQRYIKQRAAAQKEVALDRAHFVQSRIQVAAAESGMRATGERYQYQAAFDTKRNVGIIMGNMAAEIMAARYRIMRGVDIGGRAATADPRMATLMGGMEGFAQGLSIATTISGIPKGVPPMGTGVGVNIPGSTPSAVGPGGPARFTP